MQDFRRLVVWKRAHAHVLRLYAVTKEFPYSERFGLTAQIRRSAASIPTNIVEGCGRRQGADCARFYEIAASSATELEYQLVLARDLMLLDGERSVRLLQETTEIRRMLTALVRRMRQSCHRRESG